MFYLSQDKTEQSNRKSDESNSQVRNLHHRQSKFPRIINDENDLRKHLESLNKYGLARQEDIKQVLIERISDKIKKLPLYSIPKIWLLGYATEHYQVGIVENIFKDNVGDILRQSISEKIKIPNRIEKIFLFEPEASSRSIFEAK